MKQQSGLDGHMNAFENFNSVAHLLILDNCVTATDRAPICITLVNNIYERFAEHYGSTVVPAQARKPHDKSLAESSVT